MSKVTRMPAPKRPSRHEEKRQLTESEWAAHEARLAAIRAGTFDMASVVVAPPPRSRDLIHIED